MPTRNRVRATAVAVLFAGFGGQPVYDLPARAGTPPVSSVLLFAFAVKPPGILFAMHPTAARITISADAVAPLEVCPFNTTFAGRWKGGCRRLGKQPLHLPSSGGGLHVGFWVRPLSRHETRVVSLRITWHCVDRYFGLVWRKLRWQSATPSFDC